MGRGRPEEAATHEVFVLADLAGYTALTEAHGDEKAAEAGIGFCAQVRRLLPRYGAVEVKTMGDGILVRAPDAAAGAHLAARIVGDIGRRHLHLGARAAVHRGSAVERGGDWYGAGVNVAARILERAERDEVLLSEETVREIDPAGSPVLFQQRETVSLKNVSDPVQLYEVVFGADAGLPVDPVCRMRVDPQRATVTRRVDGATVYFCSLLCAETFDARG
jgi:adenylate cyclase